MGSGTIELRCLAFTMYTKSMVEHSVSVRCVSKNECLALSFHVTKTEMIIEIRK